jgi:transketolase C-terminal domain/subunit
MKMIGTNDLFALTGQYEEVLDYYGLTSDKIAESIMTFLKA